MVTDGEVMILDSTMTEGFIVHTVQSVRCWDAKLLVFVYLLIRC